MMKIFGLVCIFGFILLNTQSLANRQKRQQFPVPFQFPNIPNNVPQFPSPPFGQNPFQQFGGFPQQPQPQAAQQQVPQQPTPTQPPPPPATTLAPAVRECNMRCGESVTHEFDPVCGSNNLTYNNRGYLECAKRCGVQVDFLRSGRCRPRLAPVRFSGQQQ